MATEERTDAMSEPTPAASGPGSRLSAAREAAGLSLDQVAQQLKLAPRQVKALEDQDYAHLPGRTFTRGFVRNYARLLNLDAEGLLALMPDASNAPALEAPALQSTGSMIAELPPARNGAHNFARWLIPLILVACVVAAASYEWYRGGLVSPTESTPRPAVKPDPAGDAAPAPSSTTSAPLPNPFAEAAKLEPPPSPPPESTAASPQAVSPSPGTEPLSVAAATSPAPLLLTYRGPSWTEIRDRDGQVLVSRLVPPGSEQPIRGAGPFDIVIGNAAAVTLVYRDKPIDLTRYTRQNVARLRLP